MEADDYETNILDPQTGDIKTEIVTSHQQARDYVLELINFEEKTLDKFIDIYHFLCDKGIKELSKKIRWDDYRLYRLIHL